MQTSMSLCNMLEIYSLDCKPHFLLCPFLILVSHVPSESILVSQVCAILVRMCYWHCCSYRCVFFVFCLFFVSPCLFFLWLPEEVLALQLLRHRENGDFSILMKDILVRNPF
jgi:hypothetical protein